MRSYNITEFVEQGYEVKLVDPIKRNAPDFSKHLNELAHWTEEHTNGTYLIMLRSVVFKLERDALIFKLKYGC